MRNEPTIQQPAASVVADKKRTDPYVSPVSLNGLSGLTFVNPARDASPSHEPVGSYRIVDATAA